MSHEDAGQLVSEAESRGSRLKGPRCPRAVACWWAELGPRGLEASACSPVGRAGFCGLWLQVPGEGGPKLVLAYWWI